MQDDLTELASSEVSAANRSLFDCTSVIPVILLVVFVPGATDSVYFRSCRYSEKLLATAGCIFSVNNTTIRHLSSVSVPPMQLHIPVGWNDNGFALSESRKVVTFIFYFFFIFLRNLTKHCKKQHNNVELNWRKNSTFKHLA